MTGAPGNVLFMVPNTQLTNVPYWPTVGQSDIEVGVCVTGEFSVGYWADSSTQSCAWFIAADLDGFGGYPWTNIAPGLGYPTGWNDPSIVWGSTQSLGVGVYFGQGATPVESVTWGALKQLF